MCDEFDEKHAPILMGTHVLVGVTRLDHGGNVTEQRQFHGRVIKASTVDGVVLRNDHREEMWLPPDFESFEPAEPGEYRLRSTGEIVVNPDYTTTWTISPAEHH